MDWEAWKKFGMIWFAILMPIALLLVAMLTGAGVLWMFMLLVWICAGIMLVFLPSTPDTVN